MRERVSLAVVVAVALSLTLTPTSFNAVHTYAQQAQGSRVALSAGEREWVASFE